MELHLYPDMVILPDFCFFVYSFAKKMTNKIPRKICKKVRQYTIYNNFLQFIKKYLHYLNISYIIPSLTVAEIKNRCIPCVYWGTAIFVVVMKYSNLFFSFAFFLDRSHFAFGYELIISSEAAGFMKIICNGFTLI